MGLPLLPITLKSEKWAELSSAYVLPLLSIHRVGPGVLGRQNRPTTSWESHVLSLRTQLSIS